MAKPADIPPIKPPEHQIEIGTPTWKEVEETQSVRKEQHQLQGQMDTHIRSIRMNQMS